MGARDDRPARITGVATRVVRLPLAEPIRTAIHDSSTCHHVLVRVSTDRGVDGIGHIFAFGAGWAAALQSMVRELGRTAVGQDAADLPALERRLHRGIRFMGLRGAAIMAVAALDTACWDIAGRLREEPLWSLLGGARREVRCYASDSLWLGSEVGALAGLARARTAAGFDAMKVRIGSGRPDEDARRVAAVRDAVGGDVTLMADANQGWSRAQAIETGGLLAGYGLHWLEEPVPAEDYESLRPIHEATGLPIATGESWFGMLDVEPGLATGAVSFLMPDLERMGGVSGWATAARAARAASVPVSPHLFPEVSVHLMCAFQPDGLLEYVPWYSDLFEDPPLPRDGRLAPSEEPGLGLRFRSVVFPPG